MYFASCRGHLKLAQQVCDELGVLASSVTGVDMELKTEAGLRRARTLLAADQFSEVILSPERNRSFEQMYGCASTYPLSRVDAPKLCLE